MTLNSDTERFSTSDDVTPPASPYYPSMHNGGVMNKSYDAIIIGTGQAGPFLAIRMAKAGHKVAIIERGTVWRNLRQHRLHSDQDFGRQRRSGLRGAARGGVRRQHRRSSYAST